MRQAQTLVTMANQIGDFFRFQGDEASAMQSVAAHLRHFWAPSMRRDLIKWIDEHDGVGLSPLVKAAVMAQRDALTGRHRHVAAETQLEQPANGGDAG